MLSSSRQKQTVFHFRSDLRSVFVFELVIVFSLYLFLFGTITLLTLKQNRLQNLAQLRLRAYSITQSLETLSLQEDRSLSKYWQDQSSQNLNDFSKDAYTTQALLHSFQRDYLNQSPDEATNKQNQLLHLSRLADLQNSITKDQLTPDSFVALQADFNKEIKELRPLIQNDIINLNNRIDSMNKIRFASLGIQAIVVILSLVYIAYTYISPAFERLLKQLIVQNEKLVEADAFKTEFLSIASHQLRTPLSELKWTLSLLGQAGLSPHALKLVNTSRVSVDTMVSLVANLLNIARIEQGKLIFKPEQANIVPIVKGVVANARFTATPRNITLTVRAGEPKIMAYTDPLLLKQAIQNLVDNAVNYNNPGGNVWVTMTNHKEQTQIDVSDNGSGIDHSDMKKLFTKFYRGKNTTQLHASGSGLGLYFVKKIIDKHRGTITVKSDKSGTTFTLMIPRSA